MEVGEHIVPGRSSLHGQHLAGLIQRDLLEISSVDYERVGEEGLAAHAVSRARNRQLEAVGLSEGDQLSQLVLVGRFRDAIDGCPVQTAGIVDGATPLSESDRWFDDSERRSDRRSREPWIRRAVLLSRRAGRVLIDLEPGGDAEHQQQQHDADSNSPPNPPTHPGHSLDGSSPTARRTDSVTGPNDLTGASAHR